MKIGNFELGNEEKLERALHGTPTRGGVMVGGVERLPKWATMAQEEKDAALLAEYDRLGGLVTKDGNKVVTGSFYDFKAKVARLEPNVRFIASVEGELLEVDEDEAKAFQAAQSRIGQIKARKANKNKKKKDE